MQGNGPDPLSINGRAYAADDADLETPALLDLLLVPTLRGTACLYAPDRTPISRARGRNLRRRIFSPSAGTYQAEAGGKRSLGPIWL